MSSKKHLDLSDRIVIEDGVNRNLPVRTIAASLGKHPTTIAREAANNIATRNAPGLCVSTTTIVRTAMTVKRRMSVMSATQTSTTSTVVTAAYATTLVPSSRGCAADVWKELPSSAMAVTSTKNAPLSKCITRPNPPKGITKSFALSPGPGYPSPRKSLQNSMP